MAEHAMLDAGSIVGNYRTVGIVSYGFTGMYIYIYTIKRIIYLKYRAISPYAVSIVDSSVDIRCRVPYSVLYGYIKCNKRKRSTAGPTVLAWTQ